MAIDTYELDNLKRRIEYILLTLTECPLLAVLKVEIDDLEFKNGKYYASGYYECIGMLSEKVIKKGRFNIVIDKEGKVYLTKLSKQV